MKLISSPVEALIKPVRSVAGIVERNQSLPVVSNILIEQKGVDVTFSTTDLDIQIRTSAPVGVEGCEGNITLNAQKFSEILGALRPLDTLDVDIDDGGLADLTTSGGHFSMQTLPAQDFPVLKIMPWTTTFTLPAKTLLNQETKIEAIVPRKTVRELLRILPEDDTPVTVNVGDTQIGFNFAGIEFVSKLIEGKFPDYQRVMPTLDTNPQCVSINREELLLALRRVQILTNERFHGIRWLFTKGSLTVQGSNAEQEEASQKLAVNWEWDDLDIGFNLLYMIELLNNLKNSEVNFHFAATPKSVLVTMPESSSFRYLIMPMRI